MIDILVFVVGVLVGVCLSHVTNTKDEVEEYFAERRKCQQKRY